MTALFHMCARHLGIDAVCDEVKERVRDMNSHLDADRLRRQATTVGHLTVVTIFGLVGTVTTGCFRAAANLGGHAPATAAAHL